MGWDWEASHHVFFGAQVVAVDTGEGMENLREAAGWVDDHDAWLDYVMPSDHRIEAAQRRVLTIPDPVVPTPPCRTYQGTKRRAGSAAPSNRSEKKTRGPATNYPLVFKKFVSHSFHSARRDERPENQVNDHPLLDAYLVVKSTLVEHRFGKRNLLGNVRWGAHVEPLATVSDAERDALERVVEELSEAGEYTFGEPGWFDVARETSG